jgi:hypothetical protein
MVALYTVVVIFGLEPQRMRQAGAFLTSYVGVFCALPERLIV